MVPNIVVIARALLVVLAVACSLAGCGGSIGLLVADLRWGPDGQLVMTRCMFDVHSTGNIVTYSLRDCTRSIVPRFDDASRSGSKPSTEVVVP